MRTYTAAGITIAYLGAAHACTPQQAKLVEQSTKAAVELADHVCEATGKHEGFVDFLCTFVGTMDDGKSDRVELGPRPPIRVSVPEGQADVFALHHSPAAQLTQRERTDP